jgi:hypothetical protein
MVAVCHARGRVLSREQSAGGYGKPKSLFKIFLREQQQEQK